MAKVWVDVKTGEWGPDPDDVYIVEVVDSDEWSNMSDVNKAAFASGFGHPLRMEGCRHER